MCAEAQRARRPAWVLIDAAADDEAAGYRAFGPLTAEASAADPNIAVEAGDLWTLMYTSGTTGLPKGIQHTHFIRAMYATTLANAWRMSPGVGRAAFGCHRVQRRDDDDTARLHAGGDARPAPRVRRGSFIATVERERVTHTMLVPSQIIAILNAAASIHRVSRRSRWCSRSGPRCTKNTRID